METNPVLALNTAVQAQPWALQYAREADPLLAAEYADYAAAPLVSEGENAVIHHWRDLTRFAPTPDAIADNAYRSLRGLRASVEANKALAKPYIDTYQSLSRNLRCAVAVIGTEVGFLGSTPSSASDDLLTLGGTLLFGGVVSLVTSWMTSGIDQDPRGTEVTPGYWWNITTHLPLGLGTGLLAGVMLSNQGSDAAETIGKVLVVGTLAAIGYFKYRANERIRQGDAFAAVAEDFLKRLPTQVSAEQLRELFEATPLRVFRSGYANKWLQIQNENLASWITKLGTMKQNLTDLKNEREHTKVTTNWLDPIALSQVLSTSWIDQLLPQISASEDRLAVLRFRIGQMQQRLSQGVTQDQAEKISNDILKLTGECDAVVAELNQLEIILGKAGVATIAK